VLGIGRPSLAEQPKVMGPDGVHIEQASPGRVVDDQPARLPLGQAAQAPQAGAHQLGRCLEEQKPGQQPGHEQAGGGPEG